MLVLRAGKLSWIPMVDGEHMEVAPSLEKISQRWTVRLHMLLGGWPSLW